MRKMISEKEAEKLKSINPDSISTLHMIQPDVNNQGTLGTSNKRYQRAYVNQLVGSEGTIAVNTIVNKLNDTDLDEIEQEGGEAYISFNPYQPRFPVLAVKVIDLDLDIEVEDAVTGATETYNVTGDLCWQFVRQFNNTTGQFENYSCESTLTCVTDYGDIDIVLNFDWNLHQGELPTIGQFNVYVDGTMLEGASMTNVGYNGGVVIY